MASAAAARFVGRTQIRAYRTTLPRLLATPTPNPLPSSTSTSHAPRVPAPVSPSLAHTIPKHVSSFPDSYTGPTHLTSAPPKKGYGEDMKGWKGKDYSKGPSALDKAMEFFFFTECVPFPSFLALNPRQTVGDGAPSLCCRPRGGNFY